MTLDFPFEIWVNVASYLPPGYVRRLYAVNRHLYHLAMEDRYEKFEATTADLRNLERLRSRATLGYMKRLEIRSKLHHHNPSTEQTVSFLPTPRPRMDRFVGPMKFMNALTDALSYCSRLEEVTLNLYDLEWESHFSDFISTLLSLKGGYIHKLNVNANLCGLKGLFSFFSTRSSPQTPPFPHLKSLSLSLTTSRSYPPQPPLAGLPSVVADFIKTHKHSLHTLILHQDPRVTLGDISTLFDIGRLPHLKRLELSIPLVQVQRLECLEEFLSLNSSMLKCLMLKIMHSYSVSASEVDNVHQILLNVVLPKLHFPALSKFGFHNETGVPLPRFDDFAPNIKQLELNSLDTYSEFKALLGNVRQSQVALRSFQVRVHFLSPEHLDQLALYLPLLKSLTIYYIGLACEPDGPHVTPEDFAHEFRNREYMSWSLKYLRLAEWSNCPDGHASPVVRAAVARCIAGPEVVDGDKKCECPSLSFIQ